MTFFHFFRLWILGMLKNTVLFRYYQFILFQIIPRQPSSLSLTLQTQAWPVEGVVVPFLPLLGVKVLLEYPPGYQTFPE